MRIGKPAAALFLVLWGAAGLAAQSNPQQSAARPSTAAQMETASIYITASTKKGMLIKDVKPEDLTITEDKAPVKIDTVSCNRPEPLLLGILVDVSGSRRMDSHLLSHYDELEAFLEHVLTREDKTYVISFDDRIYKLSELMSDRVEISPVFEKLRKHQPAGATALYDAIKAAAGADFKGRSGHRILVVVGDWEDNSSRVTSDEALKTAQRTSTTVYAVVDSDAGLQGKISRKRALEVSKRITEETGGLASVVEEKNDFDKALQGITAAVLGSCRVTYASLRNPDAKKGVKLHVEASPKDVSILYPKVRFSSSQ